MPVVDQLLDDLLHFPDVLRRVRKFIDRIDPDRRQIVEIVLRHLFGEGFHRFAQFRRAGNQLVVHVGDVDHKLDLVPQVGEVALDRVKDHRPDHVSDVRRLVNRRTAKVHADAARNHGLKLFLLTSQSIVNTKCHESWIPRESKESKF